MLTNQRLPCVLLVAPPQSYRISSYIDAAAKAEIQIIVISEGKNSLVSAVAAGIQVDFSKPLLALKKVVDSVQANTVKAVIGTDDSTVELAARLARYYAVPGNDPMSTQATRRKDIARKCMSNAHLPVPGYLVLDLSLSLKRQCQHFRFPAVVKPLMLSGSRGVIRVNNINELEVAVKRIQRILSNCVAHDEYEGRHVLLEEFICGQEIAVEAILNNGQLDLLAVFDKPEAMDGPYFEESYYVMPSVLTPQRLMEMRQRLSQACQAYGLSQGPIHAELRFSNNEFWIIEIASRTIGGQCAMLLEMALGEKLESIVLNNAMGSYQSPISAKSAFGVLMIPIPSAGLLKRVEGVVKASKLNGIQHIEISIAEGYAVEPLPEGQSYLGFIFAKAMTNKEVEKILKQALACLKIIITPVLPVIGKVLSGTLTNNKNL